MSSSDLPPASSPSLLITAPTRPEQTRIWTATQPSWGAALSLKAYLDREAYLLTIPLSRDGGLQPWILTDGSAPAEREHESEHTRPILASCETLRKPALVKAPGGEVRDVWAHGVASVFTFEECRKRGYAGRMMGLLGEELGRRQEAKDGDVAFSILFSDIGKDFYAKDGWMPMQNTHISIGAPSLSPISPSTSTSTKPILDTDLESLTTRDTTLLRQKIANSTSPKTIVALLPSHDALLWHFHREDFMCIFHWSRVPSVRGAVYTPAGNPGQRVWALWSRALYGGKEKPEQNRLHFLRFVVEDEGMADELLAEGLREVVSAAQEQARSWFCPIMELWNPDDRVKRLIAGMEDLKSEFVVREQTNIASLRWFGEGSADDVEWVANEKFEWC